MSPFDINLCAAKWKALTVNEQGDMAAEELLDACESIISIFDAMGSGLAIVKSDMSGNVAHMRRNVATFGPGVSLQVMVQKEVEDKVTDKDGTTAMSLLWLTRALHFLDQFLAQLLKNAGMEVADASRAAYADTLTHHHGFAVRQVFRVAMSAVPYRKDFMQKIAGSEEKALPLLADMSPSFTAAVLAIRTFLVAAAIEK